MESAALIIELEKRLPRKRFEHVLRVTETAKELAGRFGVPACIAEQAALFHDIAKFMEPSEMRRLIEENGEDVKLFSFHHELWHAAAGRIIAEQDFGVQDQDILNAIRYHTTGRAGMSDLEKLIYIADLIEPGRDFPGITELRNAAKLNMDEAMRACIVHSVRYLIDRNAAVFPDSIECYNEHVQII
ncbi:bis(5'-nucleosyl)-tetraphosphatase (symmetrical) YqeK [Sporosarcina luteola]|uniref:bis(5'-nucleosyl)-tetraphosphatase (symmetrical) YqeK n=1 Tax=Sporosarcina luteola TaxID=582850 RepID=UPI00203DC33A|nr:bis(5'-nucleosyl)-tetraphosphatase (symmetrical) YqeK [Sporosarcina luteola]MCM3710827.1 bis(5'-nucleosyl)-tetraphosphatase (symmetrical) YqeK [Sporosarcina luteola]